MKACDHKRAKVFSYLDEVRGGEGDLLVRIIVRCGSCGARLSFLGLPTSWLPAAPHPAGSEDDGTDSTVCNLPGIWLEKDAD